MKKVAIVFQRHVLEIRKNKYTWDKGQRAKKENFLFIFATEAPFNKLFTE